MKKFSFPLEKLRGWREMQRQAEESKLQALVSEQTSLIRMRQSLEEERRRVSAFVERAGLDSSELLAADRFRGHATRQEARLAAAGRELDARLGAQRKNVLEARQRVEALNHLRESQLTAWRAELDKEQENLVAELVVARWKAAGSGL
jgi:flagellar export protein FliJ